MKMDEEHNLNLSRPQGNICCCFCKHRLNSKLERFPVMEESSLVCLNFTAGELPKIYSMNRVAEWYGKFGHR